MAEQLGNLPTNARYGAEGALYFLSAFLEQRLAEDTTIHKILKNVVINAAPELAQRILEKASTHEERLLAYELAKLPSEDLRHLLDWLCRTDPATRHGLFKAARAQKPELDKQDVFESKTHEDHESSFCKVLDSEISALANAIRGLRLRIIKGKTN
ncbi:hypothetical protein QLH52_22025 [Methylomonas sp. OY6]|uniref:Uncharacterized protein n=1 Tax=Methylomonas defluvii TaxID=3045149 RepID=A0ABU4UMF3_9GAMM|nr:hypothetical protein [Methylomonas sp. OY6]MDX8129985.1 hypothetical protein [Methylomonas sp. OY6]